MPPCVGDLVEDIDDWTFVGLCTCTYSSCGYVAHLVIVNTSDVNLPSISRFFNKDTI